MYVQQTGANKHWLQVDAGTLWLPPRKRSLRRLCFRRCLSAHRGGISVSVRGVSAPGGLCQWDPPDRDPPRQRTPLDRDPPWTETPLGQRPPGQRHPPERDPPGQRPTLDRDPHPKQRPPPQTETPTPDRDPPGQRPPDRDPLDGNRRAVRIILECILVLYIHTEM